MALFDILPVYTIIIRGDDIPAPCRLDMVGYCEKEIPEKEVINFARTRLGLCDVYALSITHRFRDKIVVGVVKES